MTSKDYETIRIALAKDNLTEEQARAVYNHPLDGEPYESLEKFVDAVINEMEDTFNLSDVRILYWSLLDKWIKAGRPDPKDRNNPIKPLGYDKIIDELESYGLTYRERDSAGPKPNLVTKKLAPPSLHRSDLRSINKFPQKPGPT